MNNRPNAGSTDREDAAMASLDPRDRTDGAGRSVKDSNEGNRLFEEALEGSPLGFALATVPDLRILKSNRRMREILGYNEEELRGLTVADITHPEDLVDELAELESLIGAQKSRYVIEKRYIRKDRSIRWVRVAATLRSGANGRLLGIGVVEDITELKETQEALAVSEERYRALVESSNHLIVVLSTDGYFLSSNQQVSKCWLDTEVDFVGRHICDVLPSQLCARYQREMDAVLKTGTARTFEHSLVERGTKSHYRDTIYPLWGGEHVRALGCVCRDITKLKQTESSLRDIERELVNRSRELTDKTTAFRELLGQFEFEKSLVEGQVVENVKRMLLPLVNRMKSSYAGTDRTYVDLLENSLRELTDLQGGCFVAVLDSLSPRELEICHMVRGNLTSKEIAGLLNLSPRSVETHRRNIRKKLGIRDRATSLFTYLNSL